MKLDISEQYEEELRKKFEDVIESCLQENFKKRYTIDQVDKILRDGGSMFFNKSKENNNNIELVDINLNSNENRKIEVLVN